MYGDILTSPGMSPGIIHNVPGATGWTPSLHNRMDWYNGGVLNKLQGRGILSKVLGKTLKNSKGILSKVGKRVGKSITNKVKAKTAQVARKQLNKVVQQAKRNVQKQVVQTIGKKRKALTQAVTTKAKKFINAKDLKKVMSPIVSQEEKPTILLPKATTHLKDMMPIKSVKKRTSKPSINKLHSKIKKLSKIPSKKLNKVKKKRVTRMIKQYRKMYHTAYDFMNRNNQAKYKF